MTIAPETLLSRSGDFLFAPVRADDMLMMAKESGLYFGLNAVGRRIWELLDTPMTVAAICARLCEEFEVDLQTCETEVANFVPLLIERGLVKAT